MPDETPTPDDARQDEDHRLERARNRSQSGDGPDPSTDPMDRTESGATGGEEQKQERPADAPPATIIDEAERLTRLAREATGDEAAAYRDRRDALLADHDYTARVREDETRDVLVCHPAEWVEDGTVRPDRIGDLDRGIERPLSGPGDGADWAAVDEHNRDIVETVRAAYGDDHAENVAALADFMGNHYARTIDDATGEELREFLGDYYPRNVWPTPEQRDIVEQSVSLAFEAIDEPCPIERSR